MGLRDQLASKKPNVTSVTFPIGDAGEKAAAQYTEAQERLEMLKLLNARREGGDAGVSLKTAEAEVAKALRAYKKVSLTLRFRGLTPTERDQLASEFAPENDDEKVDIRAYTGALLATVALESDLTAQEWIEELYESGRWSDGEVDAIRNTARAAYEEVTAPGIPKD